MKFTLCQGCDKEVMIRNGAKYDYEYPNRAHPNGYKEPHVCPNEPKQYETNGITMNG